MTSISSAGLRMAQSLDKKIRYCTALKLSFQTLEKNQHSNWALTLHVSILQDRRLMMMHLNGHGVRLKDSSNTYINHIPDLNTQLRNGRVHVKKTMYWIVEAIKNSQITWKFNGAQDNQNKISSKVNAILEIISMRRFCVLLWENERKHPNDIQPTSYYRNNRRWDIQAWENNES